MPGSSQGKEDESSDSEVASLTGPERAEAGRRDVAQLDGVERQEQSSSTDTTSNDSSYSTGPEGDPSTDDSDSYTTSSTPQRKISPVGKYQSQPAPTTPCSPKPSSPTRTTVEANGDPLASLPSKSGHGSETRETSPHTTPASSSVASDDRADSPAAVSTQRAVEQENGLLAGTELPSKDDDLVADVATDELHNLLGAASRIGDENATAETEATSQVVALQNAVGATENVANSQSDAGVVSDMSHASDDRDPALQGQLANATPTPSQSGHAAKNEFSQTVDASSQQNVVDMRDPEDDPKTDLQVQVPLTTEPADDTHTPSQSRQTAEDETSQNVDTSSQQNGGEILDRDQTKTDSQGQVPLTTESADDTHTLSQSRHTAEDETSQKVDANSQQNGGDIRDRDDQTKTDSQGQVPLTTESADDTHTLSQSRHTAEDELLQNAGTNLQSNVDAIQDGNGESETVSQGQVSPGSADEKRTPSLPSHAAEDDKEAAQLPQEGSDPAQEKLAPKSEAGVDNKTLPSSESASKRSVPALGCHEDASSRASTASNSPTNTRQNSASPVDAAPSSNDGQQSPARTDEYSIRNRQQLLPSSNGAELAEPEPAPVSAEPAAASDESESSATDEKSASPTLSSSSPPADEPDGGLSHVAPPQVNPFIGGKPASAGTPRTRTAPATRSGSASDSYRSTTESTKSDDYSSKSEAPARKRDEDGSRGRETTTASTASTGSEHSPSAPRRLPPGSAGAASTSYSASSTSPSSYTISAASRPLTAEHAFDPRFSPKPPLRANPNPRPLPPRRPAPQQDQRQAATRDVFARLYPEIFSIDAAALKKLLAHPPELKAVAHQRSPVAWDPPPPLAPRRRHRPGRGARWLPSPPSPPSPPNGGACAAATTPPPPPPCKSSPRSVQSSRTRGEASPSAPSTISRPRGLSPSTLPSATERPAPLLPAHKTEPSRPGKEAVRNPFARRRLKPRSKHNPRASPRACLQLPGIPKQTKPKAAKSKSGPVCPRPLPRIVREEALRGRILRLRHERKALLRRVEQLEASARQPSNEVPADDLQKECDASAVSETKSSGEQSSDSLEAD